MENFIFCAVFSTFQSIKGNMMSSMYRTFLNIYTTVKVSNGKSKKMREICSKLTMKTPERCRRRRQLLCKYFTPFSSVSIVYFEQVNVCWVLLRNLLDTSALNIVCMFIYIKK